MSTLASGSNLSDDKSLRPFLVPSFDPADYLNATIPSWTPSYASNQSSSVFLAEISSQTQTLLSQLNAQTNRLTSTLTQLTNEILRSGGKLAYDVDVLRADALSLSDAFTEGLKVDIQRFVPNGLRISAVEDIGSTDTSTALKGLGEDAYEGHDTLKTRTPEYINHLHTLTTVKDRLEEAVRVFGDAMQWTVPPSEVSVLSSFISVSATQSGMNDESQEAKGRGYTEKLKAEILETLEVNTGNAVSLAMARVEAIRTLATVWKGTAEEKVRIRIVEDLTKLVQDKQRALGSG